MRTTPESIVGRLAPSPTGGLHVGHARTFLAAWLAARGAGGRVILRVEDLDSTRVRPGMDAAAIEDLQWLGLDWDEGPDSPGQNGPYVQSQRSGHYLQALIRLRLANLVYPCTCTNAQRARMASAPHADELLTDLPCECASRHASDADALMAMGNAISWRFRSRGRIVGWHDLCRGESHRSTGDFAVARMDQDAKRTFAYQLAVVVDDALMGVTQVVRGDDLVESTPRQIVLYEALGFNAPSFGHIPLVVDEAGRRLAKREQAIKLSSLRQEGIEAHRLVALLLRSLGVPEPAASATLRESIGQFSFDQVPREPWVFHRTLLT
jgi:glutamyl-tRNA synthetase